MRRNKRYSKAKSNKHPILWMLTGLLIGVFICSLTFLKKKETVVSVHAEQTQDTLAKKSIAKHKTKDQNTKKNHDESTEQYDFYTMLPKMQSNQPVAEPLTPAISKPTKPLAIAEQSMLSPGSEPEPITTALATPPQNSVATTQTIPTDSPNNTAHTPPQAKKYTVTAGSFDHYDQADAEKATLVLAGITRAKIESYTKNGTTHYRLNLGSFASKANASKVLDQLKEAQLNGYIDEI